MLQSCSQCCECYLRRYLGESRQRVERLRKEDSEDQDGEERLDRFFREERLLSHLPRGLAPSVTLSFLLDIVLSR